MRILLLANVTPWPAHSGISLRILRLLERVAQQHDVTLGCHTWGPEDRAAVVELNRRGIRTVGGDVHVGSIRRHGMTALGRAFRGVPPETAQYVAPELAALVRAGKYDVLHIEESILAPYAELVPAGRRVPRVITLHNVHFVQDRRIAQIEPSVTRRAVKYFNAAWMRSYEPRMAADFDRVIAVSSADGAALTAINPSLQIDVIPNGVDTRALTPLAPPERDRAPTLLFIGSMFYRPCADGAEWLVREVMPRLLRTHPRTRVMLVGRRPTDAVRALAGTHVDVTGEVDDVVPSYAAATLSVVPLRAGGGSRLKILEAMALGRAVVSTTLGAEGLDVVGGEHIAIADDAPSMAQAIATLLSDVPRRQAMERAARALVERQYDWDDLAAKQLSLYADLA
jgi:glycosyltransferase involved in cell wall biosynthesis